MENLIDLLHLNEPEILFYLEKRYDKNIIYTYTGTSKKKKLNYFFNFFVCMLLTACISAHTHIHSYLSSYTHIHTAMGIETYIHTYKHTYIHTFHPFVISLLFSCRSCVDSDQPFQQYQAGPEVRRHPAVIHPEDQARSGAFTWHAMAYRYYTILNYTVAYRLLYDSTCARAYIHTLYGSAFSGQGDHHPYIH